MQDRQDLFRQFLGINHSEIAVGLADTDTGDGEFSRGLEVRAKSSQG